MNSAMQPIWARARVRLAGDRLHPLHYGRPAVPFCAWEGGVFVDSQWWRGDPHNYRTSMGLTGFESFVNKIHLDRVVNLRRHGWEARCVAQGILLAEEVALRAAPLSAVPIEVAITVDDGKPDAYPSSTFRFCGQRGDEWLPAQLEDSRQPLARIVTTAGDSGFRAHWPWLVASES